MLQLFVTEVVALVVGEMDSAFRWVDHYTAYKPYQNQLSYA